MHAPPWAHHTHKRTRVHTHAHARILAVPNLSGSRAEGEGWLLMTLLKATRGFTREAYHADSFEDLIAYAALMAEAKGQTT